MVFNPNMKWPRVEYSHTGKVYVALPVFTRIAGTSYAYFME